MNDLDDQEDLPESEIEKSTSFILSLSEKYSKDKDAVTMKKGKALNHLQLAGIFYSEMSKQ